MFKLFECCRLNKYRYGRQWLCMVREAPEAISGFEIRFGFFRQGMLPVRSETALPAVVAGAGNRHFAAGTGAVASAAAIAVVLIPAGSGIRFGGSFDFMVSCLGGGPYQRSFSAPEATC